MKKVGIADLKSRLSEYLRTQGDLRLTLIALTPGLYV
jgi:hypothetical protein